MADSELGRRLLLSGRLPGRSQAYPLNTADNGVLGKLPNRFTAEFGTEAS